MPVDRPDDPRSTGDPWAPPVAPAAQRWPQQQWAPLPPAPWGQPPGSQPQWGAPPDPRAVRRKRLLGYGLIAIVLVLLVGGLGAAAVAEQRRAEQVQAEVAAALPALTAFVAQERGLPFLAEVDVEVLDDDAFLDALYAPDPSVPEPRADRDDERTLQALGLLDAEVDLDDAVGTSLDAGVAGFYDPTTDRLVVRGDSVDAFTRLVLVHELTHALQDQHFDLGPRPFEQADDEQALAWLSLVEGDATRIELAWLDAQPASARDELSDLLQSGDGGAGGEPVVEATLGFPYYAGPGLVQALLDTGGQPALDAAFVDPPGTTEQVVDLATAGEPTDVAVPRVDGVTVDQGVLGVLGLSLLLGGDPLEAGPERGWDGDRYVTSEQDGVTCTVADIATDDAAAAAALRSGLQGWVAAQDDASVLDGPAGTLRLRSCAQG